MIPENSIYTGSKFFNKKIFIESFGDEELDAALKSAFHDHYHKTAPLRMARADVQLLLNSKVEAVDTGVPVREQRKGQQLLFPVDK